VNSPGDDLTFDVGSTLAKDQVEKPAASGMCVRTAAVVEYGRIITPGVL
jgi:hypothetical protein